MDFFKFWKKRQTKYLDSSNLIKSNGEEILDLTKKDDGEESSEKAEDKDSFQTPEEKRKELYEFFSEIKSKQDAILRQEQATKDSADAKKKEAKPEEKKEEKK